MCRFIGRYVIVRTFSAGVHMGTLEELDGKQVVLSNARRLWKWAGAFTLSEVAINGVAKSGTRISVVVPEILLTEAIEVIPTSEIARKKFDEINE